MLKITFLFCCFLMLPLLSMAQGIGQEYVSKNGESILATIDGEYYYSNKKMGQKKLETVSIDDKTLKVKFANSKDKNIYVFVIEWKCEKINAYVRTNPDNSKTRFESQADPCFGRW